MKGLQAVFNYQLKRHKNTKTQSFTKIFFVILGALVTWWYLKII